MGETFGVYNDTITTWLSSDVINVETVYTTKVDKAM